jgi:hypothetical protein
VFAYFGRGLRRLSGWMIIVAYAIFVAVVLTTA